MLRKQCAKVLTLIFAVLCDFLFLGASGRAAATEEVLHNFNYSDGTNPEGALILDTLGNLYGTTSQNGATGAGTVYELLPNGSGQWGYQVLYEFCSLPGCPDGAIPQSGLLLDAAGNLYGTTSQGGNFGCGHGCGTVFELSPTSGGGWIENVLYTFSGGSDGATPLAGLVMDAAGNLYGTTSSGGSNSIYCSQGCGVIFRLQQGTSGEWTQSVLHSFCAVNGCLDGAVPNGLAFDDAGNLYGTTSQLGRYDGGTLFQLTPTRGGWTGKLLHSFGKHPDGVSPNPGLVFDRAGNLFGTTNKGGANNSGTVFQLKPGTNDQWTEKILHSFCTATNCLDGAFPAAGLTVGPADHLYGTSFTGGAGQLGTVYVLLPDANGRWNFAVLYDSLSGNLDELVTLGTTENLFSTTTSGGESYLGSVFELTQ
jgi:uncharacterized repeat protein (TIGR03803 family)